MYIIVQLETCFSIINIIIRMCMVLIVGGALSGSTNQMNGIMLKEMKTAQNETNFVQNEINFAQNQINFAQNEINFAQNEINLLKMRLILLKMRLILFKMR